MNVSPEFGTAAEAIEWARTNRAPRDTVPITGAESDSDGSLAGPGPVVAGGTFTYTRTILGRNGVPVGIETVTEPLGFSHSGADG